MRSARTISVLLILVGMATAFAAWTLVRVAPAGAHCQMPCGIYDDPARVRQLGEDAATIAKAVTMIVARAGKGDAESANQLVRWVVTKEEHASAVMATVAEYFMAQRIAPVAAGADGYDAYLKKLADHHNVLVLAMKTKQRADQKAVEGLSRAIDALAVYYQAEGEHAHETPIAPAAPKAGD
jgi:nickel superoxide dismutase